MIRSIAVLLGLFVSGVVTDFYQAPYKWPTTNSPIPPDRYAFNLGLNQPLYQQQQLYSPYVPAPHYHQPQPSSIYPPNSLMLIYYRVKATKSPQMLTTSHRYSTVCKGEGITAHPDDCRKFLRCRLSPTQQVFFYEERSCPRGLAFDTNLESCNYQSRVKYCNAERQSSSNKKVSKPNQQSFFTYNKELLNATNEKTTDITETNDDANSALTPTFYMMDLPQPSSVSQDKKDTNTNSEVMSNNVSPTLNTEKIADDEKTIGKTTTIKSSSKKPSRKNLSTQKSSKRTTKKPNALKQPQRPMEQQKETVIEPELKRIETFSIGDSNESARMMLDQDETKSETTEPMEPLVATEENNSDKFVSEVNNADDDHNVSTNLDTTAIEESPMSTV